MTAPAVRTVGVEEEFLLVDEAGVPAGLGADVVAAAGPHDQPGEGVELELKEQQVETGTPPRASLAEVAEQVRAARERAARAAAEHGVRLVALATSPVVGATTVSPKRRYARMAQEYGLTAREQLTCGCHVYVEVADDEEGVAVLDRIRPWLPLLLAVSANSPYWQGEDTGYASFRSQVWHRWPTAGAYAAFGSAAAYHAMVDELVRAGLVLDAGMLYLDARLSARYPTVEVRVADVCLRAEDAVLVAALVRALVETAAREAADGVPPAPVRAEVLRAATWRAGRGGLSGALVSPRHGHPVPATEALDELLDHAAAALTDAGDLDEVRRGISRLQHRGTGADEQRAWWAAAGPSGVVTHAAAATLA